MDVTLLCSPNECKRQQSVKGEMLKYGNENKKKKKVDVICVSIGETR
jgi:hypothetical protein